MHVCTLFCTSLTTRHPPVTSLPQSPAWDAAPPGPHHSILPRLLKASGGLQLRQAGSELGGLQLACHG